METLALLSKDSIEQAGHIFDLIDIKENTRADYKARIPLFLKFISEEGLNINTFRNYKRFLESQPLATSTKNKYLTTARIFLRELALMGKIPIDISLNCRNFRQTCKHKRYGLNEEEIKKIIEYFKTLPETPNNLRLKSIVALLLFQGLRQIEIIRLNIEDIDIINRIAFIKGKGRDDKEIIYLHPKTTEILKKYLAIIGRNTGALFTCQSNRAKGRRITTRTLRRFIKDIFKRLDINKTTHGFRHFYITKQIIINNGNIDLVKKYTRHNSIEVIQVYNDNLNFEQELPRYYEGFSYDL